MAKGLGLAKHSYTRQDPARNTQLQPLGFPRLCKPRCSLSCPISTVALPQVQMICSTIITG